MFDGDGMVVAVNFKDGQATFRNRFVRTPGFMDDTKQQKFTQRGVFGTMKSGGWLRNVFNLKLKHVANTHAIYWGGRLLALWEGGLPYHLAAGTLETLGPDDTLRGALQAGETFTAHPKNCATTNHLVGFRLKMVGKNSEITVFEFDQNYNVKVKRFATTRISCNVLCFTFFLVDIVSVVCVVNSSALCNSFGLLTLLDYNCVDYFPCCLIFTLHFSIGHSLLLGWDFFMTL